MNRVPDGRPAPSDRPLTPDLCETTDEWPIAAAPPDGILRRAPGAALPYPFHAVAPAWCGGLATRWPSVHVEPSRASPCVCGGGPAGRLRGPRA